jgi:hypothetical protein
MANTVIELRHSRATGNVPTSLANGELAINTYDGKLFYRGGVSNTIQTITRFTGPAGLDTEVQFNDSGSLGSSGKLSFNKTTGLLTVDGTVRANIFSDDGTDLLVFANSAFNKANSALSNTNLNVSGTLRMLNQGGDEGGELFLDKGVNNTSLAAGITIDIFQNKLRFFETGGSVRGVFIDMANSAAAGVGTDLLNPTATPDTVARATANAAFAQANSANVLAQAAFDKANTDVTSISATAGVYGNATHVPVITLTANGRVSSIVNTAISGGSSIDSVARTTANAAFDAANSAASAASSAASAAASAQSTADTALGTDYTTVTAPAGTYGSATLTPIVTVAANGRITDISTIATSGGGSSADYFPTDNNWGLVTDTALSSFGESLIPIYDCRIDPVTPSGYLLTKDFAFLT